MFVEEKESGQAVSLGRQPSDVSNAAHSNSTSNNTNNNSNNNNNNNNNGGRYNRASVPSPTGKQSSSLSSSSNSSSFLAGDTLMKPKVDDDADVVVFDLGTGSIKAGWAGEDTPRSVIPTLVVHTKKGNGTNAVTSSSSLSSANPTASISLPLPAIPTTPRSSSSASSLLMEGEGEESSIDSTYIGWDAYAQLQQTLSSSLSASSLIIRRPIHRGIIVDLPALSLLLEYIFTNELRINPKDHSVMVCLSPLTSSETQADLARLLFDTFHIPALHIHNTSSLALFSTGRTTGLVVELGEGRTLVAPVYEGLVLRHAVLSSCVSGGDVTKRLKSCLAERGTHFGESEESIIRDIKERICRVKVKQQPTPTGVNTLPKKSVTSSNTTTHSPSSSDYNTSTHASLMPNTIESPDAQTTYELPDGTVITLDQSCREEIYELYFTDTYISHEISVTRHTLLADPSTAGSTGGLTPTSVGAVHSAALPSSATTTLPTNLTSLASLTRPLSLPSLAHLSLSMCDNQLRRDLLSNIVLSGGGAMVPMLAERIRKEIIDKINKEKKIQEKHNNNKSSNESSTNTNSISSEGLNVICDSQRMFASWIGGSMFASLSTFGIFKVTADAYKRDETIIQKRCL